MIKYKRILDLIFACTIMITSCNKNHDWKSGIIEEQFIYDTASFPSCHASTIAETPDGIIVAWFGGTHERHPDVCIYVSRKVNNSWTEPLMVADGILSDTLRQPCWNPVLYQIPGGELLLFFKIGPKPSEWDGWIIKSSDNGKTWSEKETLPEGFIGPVKNKPVLLDNGNLLCGSSTEGNGWKIHFEATPDFGKTWNKIGPISDAKTYNAIQPSILNHGNGKLQILCRSKNAVIAESWSLDTGKTWSLLQASQLPNNNSGIDAVTIIDDRHIIVYNHVKTPVNAKKGYRTPLNVAVSKDGTNWYAALILEDSEISQYSYPAVIQSKDGMVHIVYTWRRERIKYVKVDPTKLKLKKINNEKWPS
ncbi:exo-alpha-sialidase [Bacteroidota bacterium]